MQLENLKTKFLGRNSIFYSKIDSTQNEIWRLIENKNTPDGTLVFADIQDKGIGTHGRVWHTDEANNIAFSFFIKTNCNIKRLDGLTIKIANIIVDIFKNQYGINLNIKEPNDITFNNKKIGGILTQTKLQGEKVKSIVIGIGINTNQEEMEEEIKKIATSIQKEFEIEIDNIKIICEFCNEFEKKIKSRIEDY